jgi:hypothetical protein
MSPPAFHFLHEETFRYVMVSLAKEINFCSAELDMFEGEAPKMSNITIFLSLGAVSTRRARPCIMTFTS